MIFSFSLNHVSRKKSKNTVKGMDLDNKQAASCELDARGLRALSLASQLHSSQFTNFYKQYCHKYCGTFGLYGIYNIKADKPD